MNWSDLTPDERELILLRRELVGHLRVHRRRLIGWVALLALASAVLILSVIEVHWGQTLVCSIAWVSCWHYARHELCRIEELRRYFRFHVEHPE